MCGGFIARVFGAEGQGWIPEAPEGKRMIFGSGSRLVLIRCCFIEPSRYKTNHVMKKKKNIIETDK